MGRLSYEPTIHIATHPHPLYLSSQEHTHTTQTLTPISCAACTVPTSSWTYSCTPCNFHLHIPCSNLPPLIHHPSHPLHSLPLLPRPAYPEGYFDCDACGRTGSGFSYHCATCGLDLHTTCASLPLSVSHYAHSHPLTMVFSPPYENRGFSCDACGTLGGDHWLYRCAMCEFDVHLGCGTMTTLAGGGAGVGPGAVGRSVSQGRVQGGVSRVGSSGGKLMRQVMSGLVDGASQQLGQSFVTSFTGGGGGDSAAGGGGSILDVGGAILGSVFGGEQTN